MKNKKIKIFLALIIPALLLAGICIWQGRPERNLATGSKVISFDYNQALFYQAINKYPKKRSGIDISAIISPHHDTAADYTAELFQKIDPKNIKRVIIVGPNHEDKAIGDIITASVTYDSFAGAIETDDMVQELIKENIAQEDSRALQNEHSIYNIIPYVNYYFPGAKIVPLALSADVSSEQAQSLGEYLSNKIDKETILIGSIDFSHYLSSDQARLNDSVTKEALLNRNYSQLYSLDSGYLDSAATAVTILSSTAAAPEIIRNANSAEALGLRSISSSTSYFTVLFHR